MFFDTKMQATQVCADVESLSNVVACTQVRMLMGYVGPSRLTLELQDVTLPLETMRCRVC
jgi:hypothetical protein